MRSRRFWRQGRIARKMENDSVVPSTPVCEAQSCPVHTTKCRTTRKEPYPPVFLSYTCREHTPSLPYLPVNKSHTSQHFSLVIQNQGPFETATKQTTHSSP